jgi:hypothetical protein
MEKLIKLDRDVIKNAVLDSNKTAFSSTYQSKGVTYRSNDPAVVQRDEAGNVILLEGEQNQLLRIEPIATNITTTSMLKVLDTQFTYFKFPTSYPIETTLDLDLDTDIELDTVDTVYARYRPSEARIILNGTPGSYNEASKFSGILMDFVEDGVTQKSVNSYQITKEIKESGIDLRFRIKIEHRYDTPAAGFGNAYFSIIKNSPETGINRLFKGPFANQSGLPNSYWGSIGQYEVQTLNIDIVIQNDEFEIGDYFGIGATADPQTESSFHTINAVQSYWVITDASKNVDEWNQEI